MLLKNFDIHMQNLLSIPDFTRIDPGLNGIQVGDISQPITSIITAVDACQASVKAAIEHKAQVLFVHHGIYWQTLPAITGPLFSLLQALFVHNIALYACHLPLDAHPVHGNNACIATMMHLTATKPFGIFSGESIGIQGSLPNPMSLQDIHQTYFPQALATHNARNKPIKTVGIISGGATRELSQAISAGLDLYITGDANHLMYHSAQEAGIDFICGGHYATETLGVKSISNYCNNELSIKAEFVDIPTGL